MNVETQLLSFLLITTQKNKIIRLKFIFGK